MAWCRGGLYGTWSGVPRFQRGYRPAALEASCDPVTANLYQLDRPERDAYAIAIEVMAAASQSDAAREGMAAFLEKRPPEWPS